MHDADLVGHFFGNVELVGGKENGHPLFCPFFEDIFDDARVLRVEADHGFVDDEHFGIVHERRHDGDALARTVREAFDRFLHEGFEVEARDEFASDGLDARLAHLENLAGETDEFPGRQLVVEKWKIGDVGQAATGFERVGLDIVASDLG